MTSVETQDVFASEAVQWWLEKEAGSSTVNQNSVLDNLADMRLTLLDANDPKTGGHVSRM